MQGRRVLSLLVLAAVLRDAAGKRHAPVSGERSIILATQQQPVYRYAAVCIPLYSIECRILALCFTATYTDAVICGIDRYNGDSTNMHVLPVNLLCCCDGPAGR